MSLFVKKKNIKAVCVEGTVAGDDGEAHNFKFENFGYVLDGAVAI